MARPLRLEHPGAIWHVTARGNRREAIVLDDDDRRRFLGRLADTVTLHRWRLHAWVLMTNHYHLLLETPEPNLSRGMQRLNAPYSQAFNTRHGRVGHVFQGRYRAVMVESPAWLAAVCRDVLRQPVERGFAVEAAAWRWSSLRALAGRLPPGRPAPDWLAVDALLALHGGDPARYGDDVAAADRAAVWDHLRHQVFLGSEAFVAAMRERARTEAAGRGNLAEIPKAQWQAPPPPLETFAAEAASRDEAMARAYLSGAYSQASIARHFAVHYSTVSRAVRRFEKTLEPAG